jgi:hypothetical protein
MQPSTHGGRTLNHHPRPTDACCDEDYELPSADALMAGTLALMTGYAQTAPGDDHRCLMARKLVSSLFFLSEHPQVSPHMRRLLANLRTRWQVEAEAGSAQHRMPEPTPLWHAAPQGLQ